MNSFFTPYRSSIDNICKETGIAELDLFGSFALGRETHQSDVDLLATFSVNPGLIGFIRVKHRFEDLFGRKVDLVTKKGLSPHLTPFITPHLQRLYG